MKELALQNIASISVTLDIEYDCAESTFSFAIAVFKMRSISLDTFRGKFWFIIMSSGSDASIVLGETGHSSTPQSEFRQNFWTQPASVN